MSESLSEVQDINDRYNLAYESLTTAFVWALNSPDTLEYGLWNTLDADTQEVVVIELVEELYSYACGELGLPTDFVQDCFEEAMLM